MHGPGATIGQIAASAGAPVGSIYHRFGSREELLIRLWIRGIRRFQNDLLQLRESPDAGLALESAAIHVPRFCRENPAEANVLTLYRQPALISSAPEGLRDTVVHLNDDVFEAMAQLASRFYGRATKHRLQIVRTACQQSPYGLVRPYIGRRDSTTAVPTWLEDAVRASTRAILAIGGPQA